MSNIYVLKNKARNAFNCCVIATLAAGVGAAILKAGSGSLTTMVVGGLVCALGIAGALYNGVQCDRLSKQAKALEPG